MSKKNPLELKDKIAKRVEPDLETDEFGELETDIVTMVLKDHKVGGENMSEWLEMQARAVQHYESEKPSILEGLKKKEWQSDRNLGLCAAVCDIFQATLLSTCWNPDTIHFKDTHANNTNNKENAERFTKWMVSEDECGCFPEIDDFIHNRTVSGFSAAHIHWEVWYEWVDKRIPNKSGGYNIKTEKVRFEKGVVENIDNLEDLVFADYGKNLQSQKFLVHTQHMYSDDILDNAGRGIFKRVDEKWIDKLKQVLVPQIKKTMSAEKAAKLGLGDIKTLDLRTFPVDLLVWYGWYKKDGKLEKYRFVVEPSTETLLSGKPLRKINRDGKFPFVGGAFIRRPGFIRGKGIPLLIEQVINAINNVFNQKSDFQYVENCPFGFHNPAEGYQKQVFELMPGVSYPVEGKPSETVYFPNLSRSLAWAMDDFKILFEVLERLTGAASYFMTTDTNPSGTATRDTIVNEKGETKFSLWVKRLMIDICEIITMLFNLYQDMAPPDLGERVLGEEGKQLIKNLSIKSLRGNYAATMTPDIISGSKTLEKQVQLWGFENLLQTVWFDPSINPRGNWQMTADTMRKVMGVEDSELYMPPKPKDAVGSSREVSDEWTRLMQGEEVELIPGENPAEHFMGHMKQQEEDYHKLDEEYRANFDKHLLQTTVQFTNYLRQAQQERVANAMAMKLISEEQRGIKNAG